ncbi:phage tail tape measure protein [Rodentibacter ratti]|uniref:Phage tail tape measure protein n=1 Tax=Rodentibacter ratti TaxID=1906745 RepID=A0A1V3LBR4_9PAST|nr:phage tail tape measure protein [Rodentibacter ratti]
MKNLELKFILEAVDKITTPLRGVQKQIEKLDKAVKGATGELNKLKQQEKTADSFKKLQNSLQKNNQELVNAREKAKKLTEQLRNTANPTAALKRQVEAAHKAAHKMTQAQESQRRKLNQLRQSLKQGGFDTSKFKESQQKLKDKINQATAAIEKQNAAMKKLQQRQARNQAYRNSVNNIKNKSDQLRTFGQRSVIAGTAGNAVAGIMLKPALDFEQDFSRVQALTGLSKIDPKQAEQLARLRNQGIHLGATTSFTSGEVAQGQGYLAMAGFNADQIEKSMPAILAMTKAAGIEMGRVSDISSDISSGFKISADEMGRVADVLTATFSGSNTTLEGLGDTMKYLGPIATATGQDFETMSAMVGLLGNVGIKGTQAGTSLRSAMLRLAAPPKQAAKALNKLGLSAKDSKGNMRALTDILMDVERKTAKMGSGDRMAYYKAIFGTEAATAMVELVKQAGINGIQEMTDKLKNSAGRAEQVAQVMADNLLGDIKNLESAREAVGIAIYDTISTDMRETIQSFTELIRKVNEWIKANPELTAKIVKWTSAMAITITTLGALSFAMSFLFYPVARLILGVGHLTGVSGLFNQTLKKVSLSSIIANKHLFSYKTTINTLSTTKTTMIGKSIMFYSALKKIPIAFINIVKNAKNLSFWLNVLKTILRVAFSPIRMLLLGIGSLLGFLLSPIGLLVTAFVGAGILIYKNWEKVKHFFGGFWEGLKSGLAPVIEKFKPLGDLFGVVVGWIEKAVKWFTDLLSPVQSTQTELDSARNAGEKFGSGMAKAIELILTPLTLLIGGIKWLSENMPSWDGIKNSVSNAWDSTKNAAGSAWQSTKETAGNIWGKVKEATGFGSDGNQPPVQKWSGGYVGNGGKYQPMGIVHGGEYVMTKEATSRLGIHTLNSLNYGKQALIAGGLGVSVATAAPVQVDHRPPISARPVATLVAQPMNVQITINAAQGMDERMIAQQVAKELQRIQNQQQARSRNSLRDRV